MDQLKLYPDRGNKVKPDDQQPVPRDHRVEGYWLRPGCAKTRQERTLCNVTISWRRTADVQFKQGGVGGVCKLEITLANMLKKTGPQG